MAPPAYIRSGSESSFPSATDSRNVSEIETAGLRRRPLLSLIGCLAILALIAIILFIVNILIIVSLQMNHNGMRFLRFHSVYNAKTGEKEKIVHFNGNNIDLGNVVTNGHVNGYPDTDMNIYGSRVLISGEENGTRLVLQEDGCKLQNTQQFQVISSSTGRPIFSAQHPMISIDRKIKKISTNKIVTNKIRAPVDENLSITVDNLSIRGNEGVRLEGNVVKMAAATTIAFNTSRDGSLRLSGRVRVASGSSRGLALSPSPALSASIDAFRLCICAGPKQKLFLTPGNKPCSASMDICS